MKNYLSQLYQQQSLDRAQAKALLLGIGNNAYNDVEIAALLSAYNVHKVTIEELKGFKDAMLELCMNVDLSGNVAIDVCGTGGDGKHTFNISTLTAFVLAGAGYTVCKHGNYGVSSVSGSSNVLEYLGVKFPQNQNELLQQISCANIGFIHAPLFNKSMYQVAKVRKALGVKTFFNLLGPLCNPAQPKYQYIGVYNLEVMRMYQYILQDEGSAFALVHSLTGYDEISLTSEYKVITQNTEKIYAPNNVTHLKIKDEDLFGGNTVAHAAKIFMNVLQNTATEFQKEVVIINAAYAIQLIQTSLDIETCKDIARTSIESLKALQKFNQLKQL